MSIGDMDYMGMVFVMSFEGGLTLLDRLYYFLRELARARPCGREGLRSADRRQITPKERKRGRVQRTARGALRSMLCAENRRAASRAAADFPRPAVVCRPASAGGAGRKNPPAFQTGG